MISGRTGSAAEEFTYDIQTQKRGVIVGETTAGAANPGAVFDAGGGFSVFVSTGAAVNPITHANWEGVGVRPDVEVAAADAPAKAHELALKAILARGATGAARTEVQWALEQLEAEQKGVRLTQAAMASLAGSYGEREVALQDGALIYKRGRRPPQKLIPLGGDAFALDGNAYTRIMFGRDATGRATELVLIDPEGQQSSFARR